MKKPRPPEPPALEDGSYYWFRNFIHLHQGGYHYEWKIARVEAGRVQPLGMKPLDPACRYLQHAIWHGPIEPPPLDEPPSTALALHQGGNRRGQRNRSQEEAADCTDAKRHAMRIRRLAGDIVEMLFEVGKEVRQGTIRLAELVDRIEELLGDAFGDGSDDS